MPVKILDFSDAHLRFKRGDEQFALAQIVDIAIEERVNLVICNGDSFDKQSNRAEPIAAFCRQLDRLEEAQIPFAYIEGQHELDSPSWLSAHRWAQHLHKQVLTVGPYVITGLNWLPFGTLQEELAALPAEANVLVAHQVWGNWMGDIAAPQGDFEQIPEQIALVLTGDLHQFRWAKYMNAGGYEMRVLSTGATTQQKISEPHEHYCVILEDNFKIRKKLLRSRPYIDLGVLTTLEDMDRVIAELPGTLAAAAQRAAAADIPAEVARPRVRVKYHHTLAEAERRLERALDGKATLFATEQVPEDLLATPTALAAAGHAVTPLSVLGDEVDKETQPDVYGLVQRLLEAGDVIMELAAWRQEQLAAATAVAEANQA